MIRTIFRNVSSRLGHFPQKAGYKNFVINDTMAQIEKYCETCCPVPRNPPQKVTVLGAASDVGQIVALFLKQQKVIKVLALYDDATKDCMMGHACDVAHIDTSTKVEAYQGRSYLKRALYDADVVAICGGVCIQPPCCNNTLDRDLFFFNMPYVRTMAVSCASFCPQALIVVQTPPVDCNFSLVAHTLKLARVFDPRRVIGFNSINAMRANQLFCSIVGKDPSSNQVPVICGTGRCTRVPVFSAGNAKNFPSTQVECLTRLVRDADEIICNVKNDNGQGHLSIGFATARLVINCMNGLFVKPSFVDSALVEQKNPETCYKMPVCATPVTIGKGGIVEYAVPTLDGFETELLQQSQCDLEDMLNLGRCYAVGDDYHLHPCKTCPPCDCPPPCEIPKPDPPKLGKNKAMLPSNYKCDPC